MGTDPASEGWNRCVIIRFAPPHSRNKRLFKSRHGTLRHRTDVTSARRLCGGGKFLKRKWWILEISAFSSAALGRPAITYETHVVHAATANRRETVSCCTNPQLHLYGHMALNYGVALPSPISQSYNDVSLKYWEQLLTPRGMSPMIWSTKT